MNFMVVVASIVTGFLIALFLSLGLLVNWMSLKDIKEADTEERKTYFQKGRKQFFALFWKIVLVASFLDAIAFYIAQH
jgi:uncharacterized sodium:solute symporter family permease YidK